MQKCKYGVAQIISLTKRTFFLDEQGIPILGVRQCGKIFNYSSNLVCFSINRAAFSRFMIILVMFMCLLRLAYMVESIF